MRNVLKNFRNAGWFRHHLYAYASLAKRRRNVLRGRPFLFNCELFFDTRCNFSCEHCSIEGFQHRTDFPTGMTLEQIDRVARQLKSLDCFSCCLVGGEPTLRKDFCDVVSVFHRHRILPTMISNGYVLTPAYVQRLKKAGIFSIGVSINGATAESHDRFVAREGAFDRAMETIRVVQAAGIKASICVVPTHQTVADGEYARMIDFAARNGIRVNVNYPALCGRYADQKQELLTDDELRQVKEFFALPHVTSDFTVMADTYECPAGRKKVYVLPDGSVCPCTFIHISFGNVLEEPLCDIMERIWSVPLFMGHPDLCLVGESREFNEAWIDPIYAYGRLPMPWTEHPMLRDLAVGGGEPATFAAAQR